MRINRTTTAFAAIFVVALCIAGYGSRYSSAQGASGTGANRSGTALQESSPELRVSTYNIHRGKGLDGKRDVSRLASVLQQDDLSGLQEVRGPRWLRQPDQAEQLGTLLQTAWLFAPVQRRFFTAHIGNALLSRYPVKNWEMRPYPGAVRQGEGESRTRFRNLLQATVEVGGQDVQVVVTHLGNSERSANHLQYLSGLLADHPRVILLADLNRNPGATGISTLVDNLDLTDAIAATLKDSDPPWRVDWILTRGFRVTAGGMTPRGASDHPHYWVTLEPLQP